MATEVRVPATGNAGEDVLLLDWLVTEGTDVSAGQTLVTLETAKATIEVDAPTAGRVLRINHAAGEEVPEHAVLALIGTAEEATSSAVSPPAEPATVVTRTTATTTGRPASSPRARVLAERHRLDLTGLTGSGPGGRILAGDVLAASTHPAGPGTDQETDRIDRSAKGPDAEPSASVLVPLSPARRATAERIQASLQGSAQLTLTRYAAADRLLGYADRLREVTQDGSHPAIRINDLLLFATARAVARHPEANSWFGWDGIRRFDAVHLGFAVDTGRALLVPVIRDAQRLTLAGLAEAARTLVERARSGRLTAEEADGGTFTVSNLGGLGVHWFTPVLNPPQSCILGVGAADRSHPNGPTQLPLSLTFDHRALDGADAARLLADIAACIETVDVLPAF